MKKLIIASAMAFMAATPAFAQDSGAADAPAPRVKSGFQGASIAVLAGEDVLTIQENRAADAAYGIVYGGSIGYDHDMGNVVVGIQGEITRSNAAYKIDDLLVPGDRFRSEAGRDIYGGVRVGLPAGRTLLYIGAGYVNSQLKSVYTDSVSTTEQTENKGGFRVSLGAEVQRKRVFGRLEMRYQDLGDYTVFASPTGFARTHFQLVAGFGVRF